MAVHSTVLLIIWIFLPTSHSVTTASYGNNTDENETIPSSTTASYGNNTDGNETTPSFATEFSTNITTISLTTDGAGALTTAGSKSSTVPAQSSTNPPEQTTQTPTSKTEPTKTSPPLGLYIGVPIACLVVLLVLVAIVFWMRTRDSTIDNIAQQPQQRGVNAHVNECYNVGDLEDDMGAGDNVQPINNTYLPPMGDQPGRAGAQQQSRPDNRGNAHGNVGSNEPEDVNRMNLQPISNTYLDSDRGQGGPVGVDEIDLRPLPPATSNATYDRVQNNRPSTGPGVVEGGVGEPPTATYFTPSNRGLGEPARHSYVNVSVRNSMNASRGDLSQNPAYTGFI